MTESFGIHEVEKLEGRVKKGEKLSDTERILYIKEYLARTSKKNT